MTTPKSPSERALKMSDNLVRRFYSRLPGYHKDSVFPPNTPLSDLIVWIAQAVDDAQAAPSEEEIEKAMEEKRHIWRAFAADDNDPAGCAQTPDDVYAEGFEDGARAFSRPKRIKWPSMQKFKQDRFENFAESEIDIGHILEVSRWAHDYLKAHLEAQGFELEME